MRDLVQDQILWVVRVHPPADRVVKPVPEIDPFRRLVIEILELFLYRRLADQEGVHPVQDRAGHQVSVEQLLDLRLQADAAGIFPVDSFLIDKGRRPED